MDVSSMRQTGRVSVVVGIPFAFFGALLVIGALSSLDPSASAGEDLLMRIAYHINAPVLLLALAALCFLPMVSGVKMLGDANQAERDAWKSAGEWHPDGAEIVPGRLEHSTDDGIWQEWEDADGYHRQLIRRWTAAEKREREIQNGLGGGYGKIDYRGDQHV